MRAGSKASIGWSDLFRVIFERTVEAWNPASCHAATALFDVAVSSVAKCRQRSVVLAKIGRLP